MCRFLLLWPCTQSPLSIISREKVHLLTLGIAVIIKYVWNVNKFLQNILLMLMMCVMFLHSPLFFSFIISLCFQKFKIFACILKILKKFFTSLNCSGFCCQHNYERQWKITKLWSVTYVYERARRMTISSFVFADTDPESCETIS